MSKAQPSLRIPDPGFPNAGATRESFESMSNAFTEWLQNANRVQTEMIRFLGDRFSKDLGLLSRFATCKQPEEFLRLQAEAMSEIANDYMQEGAKLLALFGEASRNGAEEVSRAASAARRSAT